MPDAGSHRDATSNDARTKHVTGNAPHPQGFRTSFPRPTNAGAPPKQDPTDPATTELHVPGQRSPNGAHAHTRAWYYEGTPLPRPELRGKLAPRAGFTGCYFSGHELPIDAFGLTCRLADDLQVLAEQHRNAMWGLARFLRAFPRNWRYALLASDQTLEDCAAELGMARPRGKPIHGKYVGERAWRARAARRNAKLPAALVSVIKVTGDPADQVPFAQIHAALVERMPAADLPAKSTIGKTLAQIGAVRVKGGPGSRWRGVRLLPTA